MNWPLKRRIFDEYGTHVNFCHVVKESESFVSKVVRNRRKLSTEKMHIWAKMLNCEIKDIFELELEKN